MRCPRSAPETPAKSAQFYRKRARWRKAKRAYIALTLRSERTAMQLQARHRSVAVDVGGVIVGGGAPIVVQSMTNTDTADVEATARQVAALAHAGSEIVRITVDR